MKGKRRDDDLLCSAGDEIDNAVFAAILSRFRTPGLLPHAGAAFHLA